MISDSTFQQFLISFRQDLHAHPELSKKEVRTTHKIREQLELHQITILPLTLATGLVAEIIGDYPGPTIVLRGDIDALPIQEENDVAFRSVSPGIMHACGHDFHTTALLGAAIQLKKQTGNIYGRILFVFQPAEEIGYGAAAILETGLLNKADAIFGWHNDPTLPLGTAASCHGAVTASVDAFDITITGRASHAAKPNEGNDPFIITSQLITAFQTIISRFLPSSTNAVVSITQIHGGNNRNVIPEKVVLSGTVRAFDLKIVELIKQRMQQLVTGLAFTNEAIIELEWVEEFSPATNNHPELTDFALQLAELNGFTIEKMEPLSIGEDFANYQTVIPGAFVFIGSGSPYPLHHPQFKADDNILLPITNYLVQLALATGQHPFKKI